MSRSNKFLRGPSFYRRCKPSLPPSGKAFLIVTEGEKTEPNYLKALRNRLQLQVADVEIVHPDGTDPKTLTQKAIELKNERKRAAKRGYVVEYDEIWVLFDLEKTHDERRQLAVAARTMRGAAGIKFAISDPCFEYWLLLHDEYTTAQFADCSETVKRLKRHWPNYDKGLDLPVEYIERLPVAVKNAEQCRAHHQCAGDGQPATDVDLLARSLNTATRKHLQFALSGKN